MEMHIIYILIFSLLPLLALSLHTITPQLLLCVAALCPISLYCISPSHSLSSPLSSIFIFLFINSLFCSLYYSSVSHFSLLSPQALCCSSSSTVITAVLCSVCSTTPCLLKLLQGRGNCEVLVFAKKFGVSREQAVLLLHPSVSLFQHGH